MFQIKSLLPVSLYTYLAFIIEEIWLPNCIYKSHSQLAKWPHRANIFAHVPEHNQLQYKHHILLLNMCKKHMPPSLAYMKDVYTCATYEVNTVHIFYIYCSANMVTTLHIYFISMLLQCTYRSHSSGYLTQIFMSLKQAIITLWE